MDKNVKKCLICKNAPCEVRPEAVACARCMETFREYLKNGIPQHECINNGNTASCKACQVEKCIQKGMTSVSAHFTKSSSAAVNGTDSANVMTMSSSAATATANKSKNSNGTTGHTIVNNSGGEELWLQYKNDRKAHLQSLRRRVQLISREVFKEHKVSGASDVRVTDRSGLLLVCKAPQPWLFIESTTAAGYDSDTSDDGHSSSTIFSPGSDGSNSSNTAQQENVWLFVEANLLIDAHDQAASECLQNNRFRIGNEVLEFLEKLSTTNRQLLQHNVITGASLQPPLRLLCELDDYTFEAVACIIDDYKQRGQARNINNNNNNSAAALPNGTKHAISSSRNHKKPNQHKKQHRRRGGSNSKRTASGKNVSFSVSEDDDDDDEPGGAGDSDAAEVIESDAEEYEYQVAKNLETFDFGQGWWTPSSPKIYRRMLHSLRVYPRVAEPLYELSQTFGRVSLKRHCEKAMLWQWGVEVRKRMAWSIPCFSWLSSKLAMAGTYGSLVVQNFLLIHLEVKFLALNEALALYENVAKTAPIVAMYVERELTDWQMQDAGALEWILSEIDVCEASKNNALYTSTLANAILLRAACKPEGKAMLTKALKRQTSRACSKQSIDTRDVLETYNERYQRMLLLAGLRAKFSIQLSDEGIPNVNLREILQRNVANSPTAHLYAAETSTEKRQNCVSDNVSDDDDGDTENMSTSATPVQHARNRSSSRQGVPATKSVSFTFDLCRSSKEFAIQLARALNIGLVNEQTLLNDADAGGGGGASASGANDSSDDDMGENSQEATTTTKKRSSSISAARLRSTVRRSRAAAQQQSMNGNVASAGAATATDTPISTIDCNYINWNYIQVKQRQQHEEAFATRLPARFARATESYQSLPFVYMPCEDLLNIRTHRRNMPLAHPVICMLMHTLYENDTTNLMDEADEKRYAQQQTAAAAAAANAAQLSSSSSKHKKHASRTRNKTTTTSPTNTSAKSLTSSSSSTEPDLHFALRITARDIGQLFSSTNWKWQGMEGKRK